MRILGLSNMRDAAAALVANGRIIAAAEEERFVRIKHVTALPVHAARFCLQSAGIQLRDLDGPRCIHDLLYLLWNRRDRVEIEDPFEARLNDLPLEAICGTIESNLLPASEVSAV